ncbi:MAG: hydrogenase formation protein HypD [Candidatus Latescibacteria bacterium]|nr:hydrogenase formation protein HypD [Candidatus Latescibacterota bacterium]
MIKTSAKTARILIDKINEVVKRPIKLMEVCGTHTNAISASGIRQSMPKKLQLLSGPGCPVCVTAQSDIDWVIGLARTDKAVIATFGDLMRVPGTESTLEKEKAQGANIRVVYSCLDSLKYAEDKKPAVFIGVGFETTAPTIAGTVIKAHANKIKNFYVAPFFKLIPPALRVIASNPGLKIDGFILPGHVSTIIGKRPYQFLVDQYRKPCAITGFEALDILQGIYLILKQLKDRKPEIAIQYERSVNQQGNLTAQKIIKAVFKTTHAEWRGLGVIKDSGLLFANKFARYDARAHFTIKVPKPKPTGCRCGDVLLGSIIPPQCGLFAKICTPSNPIGPCMVSSEGACAAYYKYER